jgi:hypothetical protein
VHKRIHVALHAGGAGAALPPPQTDTRWRVFHNLVAAAARRPPPASKTEAQMIVIKAAVVPLLLAGARGRNSPHSIQSA